MQISPWYDPSLGRFASADTLIPDPGNPLDYDRYAYVRNNALKYTDPSGHEVCLDDGQCLNQNDIPQQTNLVKYWKDLIKSNFGISISDTGGRNWSARNLSRIYSGLLWLDHNILNGTIKKYFSGSTFYLSYSPDPDKYSGWTERKTITFYTNRDINYQNFYHEFGHLLDNVIGNTISNKIEATAHYAGDKYVFGGSEAVIPADALIDPTQDAFQHPSNDAGEQWADMFANYVTGNIDVTNSLGQVLRAWTMAYLYPYFGMPGC